MGMSIKTNVGGNTACGNLKKSGKKGDKNLQKLASGYKINSAADDASGMGITEKMRAQIGALTTVVGGCDDGVNLVKTADGYLGEMQDMVVRMTELTAKSTDGILNDEVDRAALQEEMNHLGAEIDRIATTANFNGNKLFEIETINYTEIENYQVTVPESVPNSQYIKDVTKFPDDKALSIGKDETVKFLSEKIGEYKNEHGEDALDKKAIYYGEGNKAVILDDDATDAQIKAALGLGDGENYMKADVSSNKRYSYRMPVPPAPAKVDGDESGSKTAKLISNAITPYREANGIKSLGDKVVYYPKNGAEGLAFVGDANMSDADIKAQLGGLDYYVSPKLKVYTTSNNAPHYSIPHTEDRTRTVHKTRDLDTITLQVGETSERADKLNLNKYGMHTDDLFKWVNQREELLRVDVTTKHIPYDPGQPYIEPTYEDETSESWNIGGDDSGDHGDADKQNGKRMVDPGQPYRPPTPEHDEVTRTPVYGMVADNALRDNTDTSAYDKAVTLDISTQENAIKNLDYVKSVSNYISLVRADYGSKENRLDYTINNINTSAENISAAKSRIKDTDMAKEMMEYTQNNVVTQSAQSMLAQANTRPQDVLQLLQ